MATSTAPAAPPPPAPLEHRPGWCNEHPNQRLVTHRAAGIRWYGAAVETVCIMPGHDDATRERCRWCGGPLFDPTIARWQQSDRKTFCSPNHRLRAHRAAARASKR